MARHGYPCARTEAIVVDALSAAVYSNWFTDTLDSVIYTDYSVGSQPLTNGGACLYCVVQGINTASRELGLTTRFYPVMSLGDGTEPASPHVDGYVMR